MDAIPHRIYEFGEFQLDARRNTLRRRCDDRPLDLTPKALSTLVHLIEHAGQLVEKRALLAAVWPNVVVEEGTLTQAIHVLRRTLREHPDDHRFIVTIPGRGYRFVADVEVRSEHEAAAAYAPDSVPSVSPGWWGPRVVAAGLAVLSGVIATLLYVGYPAGTPNMPAQRPARAAAEVAITANEDYLKGKFFLSRRGPGDLQRALQYYERAVKSDPGHAAAWAGIAAVSFIQTDDGLVPREAGLARLLMAARRSLALDPGLAEGYVRLAGYYDLIDDVREADRHFSRALALAPTNPLILAKLAGRAARSGRLDEAIELQTRAAAVEPLSVVAVGNLGYMLFAAGRLEEARIELLKAIELNPRSDAEGTVGQILVLQRKFSAALELMERSTPGQDREQGLALVYHALGRAAEADAALARLITMSSTEDPFRIAEVHAYRGDADESFKWLALATRPIDPEGELLPAARNLWEIRASPLLSSLHADPRWTAWVSGHS